jgi:hypothetical protein
MSLPGWIVVRGGAALELAGVRVFADGVAGSVGQAIPVPSGLVAVAIEVPIRVERLAIDARIDIFVPVTSARTTEIEIPAARILRRAESCTL